VVAAGAGASGLPASTMLGRSLLEQGVMDLLAGGRPIQNMQISSLSEAEEEKLLQRCNPRLDDHTTLPINAVFQQGEILNLAVGGSRSGERRHQNLGAASNR
jgi:hypothetical protein